MFERKGYKLGSIRREESPLPDGPAPAEEEATKKAVPAKKAAQSTTAKKTEADG